MVALLVIRLITHLVLSGEGNRLEGFCLNQWINPSVGSWFDSVIGDGEKEGERRWRKQTAQGKPLKDTLDLQAFPCSSCPLSASASACASVPVLLATTRWTKSFLTSLLPFWNYFPPHHSTTARQLIEHGLKPLKPEAKTKQNKKKPSPIQITCQDILLQQWKTCLMEGFSENELHSTNHRRREDQVVSDN